MNRRCHSMLACMSLITSLMVACVNPPPQNSAPLQVFEVSPSACQPGCATSLSGLGFGIQGVEDQVTLSGEPLEVLYWSDQRIDVRIPAETEPGAKLMMVSASRRVSDPLPFEVAPRPPTYSSSDAALDMDPSVEPDASDMSAMDAALLDLSLRD